MADEACIVCKRKLKNDDIGFHKKVINRGATEHMCIDCVCKHFGMTREKADEMIERFRKSGCTLFW